MLTRIENKHWRDVEHQEAYSTWSAYLLLRPFLSENLTNHQQKSMVGFLGSSVDTLAQSVSLATDPKLPDVHIALETESKNTEEALSNGVVAALSAFASIQVDPQTVILIAAHVAHEDELKLDRHRDPAILITDDTYRLRQEEAQDVYRDEQENYAHLLSFSRIPQ